MAGDVGTLEVLSKASGWMTIAPSTMSRKSPIDKHVGKYGEQQLQTSLSNLAPAWMHEQSKGSEEKRMYNSFKRPDVSPKIKAGGKYYINPISTNGEPTRVVLVDSD